MRMRMWWRDPGAGRGRLREPGDGVTRVASRGRATAGAKGEERPLRRFLLISGALHMVCFALAGILPNVSREPRLPLAPLMVSLVPLADLESRAAVGSAAQPRGTPAPAPRPAVVQEPAKTAPKTPKPAKTQEPPPDRSAQQSASGGAKEPEAPSRPGSPFGSGDSLQAQPSAASNLRMAGRIDDAAFGYDYYLPQIVSRISAAWEQPAGISGQADGPATTIRFRIQRNGAVTELVVEEPSPVPLFDQSAQLAVAGVQPLPPLPPAYGCEWLMVHLRFVYSSDATEAELGRR